MGFEWWLDNRLTPAFEKQPPRKKITLAMDNAPYHHQMNTAYKPEKGTPDNATTAMYVRVLREEGCTSIKVPRVDRGVAVVSCHLRFIFDHSVSVCCGRKKLSAQSCVG